MHTLGKVLMFFVLIGWIAAVILSVKYLDLRNQWMARAQKLEKEYTDNIAQVETRRKTLALKQKELARLMLPWDRYWNNIAGQVDTSNPKPALDVGTNRGLQEKQQVFLFGLNTDGTSTYAGANRVATTREDRAQFEPVWRVRAGDVPAATTWRVRSMIPAHYETRFNDIEVQFLIAEEDLKSQQRELARQKEAIAVAEEHLQLRIGEINGVKELEGKPLPAEISKGLLTVMVEEEEIRNAALAEVDRLLRSLKDANERFERIRRENSQLVGSLPQPESAPEANVNVTNR